MSRATLARMRNRPDNHLYYGDNLSVLREHIADASIDLIYLDPPFNSNANYNILFKSPAGTGSDAQIEAFEDTWHWNDTAEDAFDQVARSGHTHTFELLNAMRRFLGDNDMLAYLTMMAVRLLELHRVLKSTGSLYLHCDPTASHYLKLLLDSVFGKRQFANEIIWCYRRYTAASNRYQRLHDTLLFYSKSDERTFNDVRVPYGEASGQRDAHYKQDEEGRWFRWQKRKDQEPYKIFLSDGVRLGDWWDLPIISASSKERLGYPTQKPVALLERIVAASSNEGDVVLDPFCGCGTAVHAAQKLGRHWIGIDVTHLAISLIEKRMQAAFPTAAFTVEGTPKDLASAHDLAARDKYQFQWWAVSMVDAVPYGGRKKGADGGIDGLIYFKPDGKRTDKAIVSVKGGDTVGVTMIRDLHSAMTREGAPIGIFVTRVPPTRPMLREATAVGRFEDGFGRTYPKLQILTIADLFAGKKPDLPYPDPTAAFRRAAREDTGKQGSLL